MFIFDMCHHSSALGTPVKYEHDIKQINRFSLIQKNGEHQQQTQEVNVVTPTPGVDLVSG